MFSCLCCLDVHNGFFVGILVWDIFASYTAQHKNINLSLRLIKCTEFMHPVVDFACTIICGVISLVIAFILFSFGARIGMLFLCSMMTHVILCIFLYVLTV